MLANMYISTLLIYMSVLKDFIRQAHAICSVTIYYTLYKVKRLYSAIGYSFELVINA